MTVVSKKRIEHFGEGYPSYRIPGMVQTARGTLLAYYECRLDVHSDWDAIDVRIIRSTDGGESWDTVQTVPCRGQTLNNPVMIVDGEQIHFLYCENYRRILSSVSTDDGLTFSEPREITHAAEEIGEPFTVLALGPGHGICHGGRMLVPIWYANDPTDPKAHHPSFLSVFYSDDHGESWHVGEIIGRGVLIEPSESALAVSASGELLISIRNEGAQMMRALASSRSGIDGWSTPRLMPTLPDPVCQGSMDHANGVIYHVNCNSSVRGFRTDLTLKVSEDLFETFDAVCIDEEGGYADVAADGKNVYVFYERAACRMGRELERDGLYFARLRRE